MSLLSVANPTLVDLVKSINPDGTTADVAMLLAQSNEILDDIHYMEANNITSHRTTQQTGMGETYYKTLNVPTPSSKMSTAQIDEVISKFENWLVVDDALLRLNPNPSKYMTLQLASNMESMSQKVAQAIFYGNSTIPGQFNGLSNRYSSLSAPNAQNIINAGGAGAATKSSIWVVKWGPGCASFAYPKGSTAGLEKQDFGKQANSVVSGGVTGELVTHKSRIGWDLGLVLEDWRKVVRIANIETAPITANLWELLTDAIMRDPNLRNGMGKTAIYMNRTLLSAYTKQTREDVRSGGQLNYREVNGKIMFDFMGIPVRICDQITNNESVVS